MDLKLHMFTSPRGKQGRGSAGRAHVLTLYTNILPSHPRFLHPLPYIPVSQLCSAGLGRKHQHPSPPAHGAGAAVSSLVSSGQK